MPARIFLTAPERRHRKRRLTASDEPPPVALTLVAATYEEDAWVELTFDRAIDTMGMDPYQVHVNDGVTGTYYNATGTVNLINPTTVQIELEYAGGSEGPGRYLVASASTGIVAVDDGAAWSGTSNTALPFP